MGNGIAQIAAENGFSVVLADVAMDPAEKGLATIAKNMALQASKGIIPTPIIESEEVLGVKSVSGQSFNCRKSLP
jgi:3-hydroxyacyl-CoA dehydrogenase